MSNPLLQAALDYANRGWPIFPARADKTPYTDNGVLDATTDAATINAWWTTWPRANVAMDVGGAGMMVLDLDPGHDKAALNAAVGGVPETALRARTPRGGEHWFFEIARGEIVAPSAGKLAPNVDVRSFHSYVLLAPSRTPDGEYRWEGQGRAAFRTDEMVRLTNTAREKHEDRDNWLIEPDMPENVASAVAWLKTDAKIAVEGVNGDNMAYATAAHLKSFGISEELAFDLMWEHWNPRCAPPWSAEQVDHLETKVRNGYTYNTSPPGNITAAYRVAKLANLYRPVAAELGTGLEVTAGRFRFVDRAGMGAIKPPEWLVHDLLPEGAHALLVGAPGTFKTFVALDIALSVASGANFPWDGLWGDVKRGPVLFAVGEGRPQFAKRVKAWEQRYWNGNEVDNLVLADPVPLIREELDPFVQGALRLSPNGYRLIVVDTVGRAMQGVNENAQENASAFTAMVQVLQRELGATVLALHHTGHDGERARGSSVFGGDADTVLLGQRPAKEMLVNLAMHKQKDDIEWQRPKVIKLDTVQLGGDQSSLVAVRPTEADLARHDGANRAEIAQAQEQAVERVLDNAIVEVLASNPARAWTSRELAQAIAMREDVSVSSKTLENRYLVSLRETKGTLAGKSYDPATRKWRHVV